MFFRSNACKLFECALNRACDIVALKEILVQEWPEKSRVLIVDDLARRLDCLVLSRQEERKCVSVLSP